MSSERSNDYPLVSTTCKMDLTSDLKFAFGGFGTFFNRQSLHFMTRPITCGKSEQESRHVKSICDNLRRNRIGEMDVFNGGDSVFDIFYKYSAQKNFCLHSDWVIGYMITFYSGGYLSQLYPRQCRLNSCTLQSISCHNQSPRDMEEFTLSHNQEFLAASL